jgi:hypothetical protein
MTGVRKWRTRTGHRCRRQHTRTATITTATRRTGRVRRPTRTRDGAAGPDVDGSGSRAAMPTARRPGQPRQVRGQGQDRSTRAAGHCFRRAARAVRWLGDNGSPPTTRTPPPKFGLNDSRCRGLVDGGQGFLEHLGRVAARPGGHVVHSGCGDVESERFAHHEGHAVGLALAPGPTHLPVEVTTADVRKLVREDADALGLRQSELTHTSMASRLVHLCAPPSDSQAGRTSSW